MEMVKQETAITETVMELEMAIQVLVVEQEIRAMELEIQQIAGLEVWEILQI